MFRDLEEALDPSTRSNDTLLIKYEHMVMVISKSRDVVPTLNCHLLKVSTERSELTLPFERVSLPRSSDYNDLAFIRLRKGPRGSYS